LTDVRASVLLRQTDDFLFVSTDREQARRFVQRMHAGSTEYGLSVNPEKSAVNFDVSVATDDGREGQCVPRFDLESPLGLLPWCGLLFDPRTGEVRSNHLQYGQPNGLETLRATLTVERSVKPGVALRKRVKQAVRPRIHALLLDATIQPYATVLLNFHESFLLAAAKMVLLAAELKHPPSSSPAIAAFYVGTVLEAVDFGYFLALGKAGVHSRLSREGGCDCPVSRGEVRWLGLHAFAFMTGGAPAALGFGRVRRRLCRTLHECEGGLQACDLLRRAVLPVRERSPWAEHLRTALQEGTVPAR